MGPLRVEASVWRCQEAQVLNELEVRGFSDGRNQLTQSGEIPYTLMVSIHR